MRDFISENCADYWFSGNNNQMIWSTQYSPMQVYVPLSNGSMFLILMQPLEDTVIRVWRDLLLPEWNSSAPWAQVIRDLGSISDVNINII